MIKPMVSIIIPTYNREKLLERSIESILKQTYKNFELIIVDDGSVDETKEMIEKFREQRINYVRNDKNRGAASARNLGISLAKYDYIAFQDSDDVWMADKLEKQMAVLSGSNEDTAFIYCSYLYHGEGIQERVIIPRTDIDYELKRGDIFKQLLLGNLVGTPTMVVKKEVFERVGTFNEKFLCLEDYEMVLRLAKSYKAEFLDEILVNAYSCEESVSNNMEACFRMSSQIIEIYKNEIINLGIFDEVVGKLFHSAAKWGKLEEVKEMLVKVWK